MKEKNEQRSNRRDFLKNIWKYLGVIALLELIVVAFSMMRSGNSGKTTPSSKLKLVGSLSDIPPGTVMPIRSGRFFLIRLDDGGLMAISMICSHLGCTVNWDTADNVFKCPCHSSSFDHLGNVIKSPATKALNYYRVKVDQGEVIVDLDKFLVRKKFDPSVVTYV